MQRGGVIVEQEVCVSFEVDAGDAGFWNGGLPGSLRVEFTRMIPVGDDVGQRIIVRDDDDGEGYRAFERCIEQSSAFASAETIGHYDGQRTYRLERADGQSVLFELFAEHDAAIQEAVYETGSWLFEARFSNRASVSEFYEACRDHGITPNVVSIQGSTTDESTPYGLTAEQRETLVYAFERGYFDIPRSVTMVQLAGEMGVSDQSLSERLRRATASLVEQTVI